MSSAEEASHRSSVADGDPDDYLLEANKNELIRQHTNHVAIKGDMGGRLLMPEVEAYLRGIKGEVKVADVGTADGGSMTLRVGRSS